MYASDALINSLALSDFSVKIGGEDCVIASKSDIVITSGGTLNITCTTPTMTRWGSYDVVATIGDYGTFDLPKENGYHYYIPYNTMKTAASGAYKMQEFTTKTCSEMPTPAAYSGTPGTSNYHVVGSYYDKSKPSWYDENGNETTTNPVAQLILTDSRDGRTYQVRKYADGNCWMAQNLELTFLNSNDDYSTNNTDKAAKIRMIDGSAGGTALTADDTDLHTVGSMDISREDSKIFATQKVAKGTSTGWQVDGADGVRSFSYAGYDVNQVYVYDNGTVTDWGQIQFSTSNSTREPSWTMLNGQPAPREETRGGNLYNWTAATLKSGINLTGGHIDAEDSICPTNWQLPTNELEKKNDLGNNYSVYSLVKTYYGSVISGNPRGADADAPKRVTEQNMMRSEPISMAVSGYYNRGGGTVGGRTDYGSFVWSATSSSSGFAYSLDITPSNFYLQYANIRSSGFIVRCVAR
ncbi:MAG: FISUMP domain-containing protein [Candidatus Saccharibacteria bacterium]|nr:FISUMP domain-containing protein [Candidatus Saccharibacteria bacterium]